MKGKKAQAALEFLMTYGWAILVVLIVIGALAYFGVLNPNILVPEKCTLQTGLACKDFRVTTTNVTLSLQNGMGKGIVITKLIINQTGYKGGCVRDITGTNGTIAQSRDASFEINCSDSTTPPGHAMDDVGSKIKLDVAIVYYFQDSSATYSHTMNGEMLVKLEK